VDALGALAKEMDLPLAVKADSVEALVPLSTKLTEMGLKDLVLDAGSRDVKKSLDRPGGDSPAALKDLNRAVGFPPLRSL
jgi:acetyl-CoA decarbonylase/synthase complex subunit gamma